MYNGNLETENLKSYFKALERFKPLTKRQEQDLLIDYKINHNIEARNTLIKSNLKYACSLASSFKNRGISFSDLISEANDGLIDAIENYDLRQNVKVICYAKWGIIQNMQRAIEKKNRMPSAELPFDKDAPILDDDIFDIPQEGTNQQDNTFTIEMEDTEEEKDKKTFLNELYKELTPREADMVNLYYGLNGHKENTLDKIGEKYNLTKERVRQIIDNAFTKMRSKSMMIENQYFSR